jgi:hypothetical protein
MMPMRLRYDCASGRHQPRPAPKSAEQIRTTICRKCGCTLIRTLASHGWFLSGELG